MYTFSSSIISYLSKKSLATAYFFFDGRDSQTELQLHHKLIQSLIWQLSLKCGQDVPEVLVNLYNHCGKGHYDSSLDYLEDTLQTILDGFHSVFIVLDALDECAEREKVLDWIQTLISQRNNHLGLHLVFTSRPEKEIIEKLQPLDLCCVDLVEESGNHDIAVFLDYQLQNDPDLQKWDLDTQNQIRSMLVEKADGMYVFILYLNDIMGDKGLLGFAGLHCS